MNRDRLRRSLEPTLRVLGSREALQTRAREARFTRGLRRTLGTATRDTQSV